MEIIKEGITYKLFNYSDKDKYTTIQFVEKVYPRTSISDLNNTYIGEGGIVEMIDGITSEEIWYMMLDRYKTLDKKSHSGYNQRIIDAIKEIIGATKDRKRKKFENKKKYNERFKFESEG